MVGGALIIRGGDPSKRYAIHHQDHTDCMAPARLLAHNKKKKKNQPLKTGKTLLLIFKYRHK